jgi:hypothetical protein
MYIMTYKRGGRKSRRGGQTEEEEDYTTSSGDTTSSSNMQGDDEEEEVVTPTAMGGKRRVRSLVLGRAGGRSRRRRGGQSAAFYEMNTLGNGQTQWGNVFSNPQTQAAPTGNGLWNANATQNVSRFSNDPSLGKLMQGGKRRHKKTRRGGNLMDIVGQAVVPFGLLGLQQTYSRRKSRNGGRKSRRGGRKSKSHSKR